MKIRRRVLLGGGVASVLLIGTGISVATADLTDGIARFIRRSFPGLRMDEAELTSFSHDMAASWNMSDTKKSLFASMLTSKEHELAGSYLVPDKLYRAQGEIVSWFMRSTDYASLERGEGAVHYLGFADPYKSGCSNPVAIWRSHEAAWPSNIA
jgi:hypothetical protein